MGPLNPHQGCNTKFCLQIPTPTINVHLCKKSFLSTFSVPITGKIATGEDPRGRGWMKQLRISERSAWSYTRFHIFQHSMRASSCLFLLPLCNVVPCWNSVLRFQSPGEQSKPISHWKAVHVYIEGTQFFVSGKSTKINLVDTET